ncbi:MAG: hypothetical protein A2452_04160 [Candidatus Firestonebacteria bacterium RIFOXYC2_FULL_39_67]|nr:MAG: hypothetical protein A2536_08985 [Candidatus Firestonebacteria bacterium RIFOXYD2_FULL_39_29]OGF56156.1 MAG: hypothetical protein A2452_04160 [Candidatus Firestonebacteria bacterium RIFOXYC2_FULL_39_67]
MPIPLTKKILFVSNISVLSNQVYLDGINEIKDILFEPEMPDENINSLPDLLLSHHLKEALKVDQGSSLIPIEIFPAEK